MANGKSRLCKGAVVVKCPEIKSESQIGISRVGSPTKNAGVLSVTRIIAGKGFRITSTSKRDNALVSWGLS